MRRISTVLIALAFVTLAASAARAHAFLDHSSPAVGSTVPAAPASIDIWFTQELEPAFSIIEVKDASGRARR